MPDAVHAGEASSEAWLSEQRKYRELTASVRTLGEIVDNHASGLDNVLGALQGVGEAAWRPLSRSGRGCHRLF